MTKNRGLILDLNCDLGEGEPPGRTRALMRLATSVSIACGVHAGDAPIMERCVKWAKESGVRVGAHPGLAGDFGRAETPVTPTELQTLVLLQVGALHRLTEVHRLRLHHVKLHGALYHGVERDPVLAAAYLETVARWFWGLPVYVLAGGRLAAMGHQFGVKIWEEAFLDRAYRPDGSLVSRSEPGAVISEVVRIRRRLREIQEGQGIEATDGSRLILKPQTLCVHGDTPQSLSLLRSARRWLATGFPGWGDSAGRTRSCDH